MRSLSVLLILLSLCAVGGAQEACPWLTQGTAAVLLGGDVSASVHVAKGEGTCEFSRVGVGNQPEDASAANLKMRIAVSHLPPKECATGEHLNGIGQDAVFCATDWEGEHQELIRGRVRATFFLLTLATRRSSGSDLKSLRRVLEQAAEEVAGSLF